MVANRRNPVWMVLACAAFVVQVVPQAWSGECGRGCCAAQDLVCCPDSIVPPLSTSRGAPADAVTACPLCAATSHRSLANANESPCHCQLDAKQGQSLVLHEARATQRDDLPVWGEIADTNSLGASRGLGAVQTYAAASLSIPIRPVRVLYGVWRN